MKSLEIVNSHIKSIVDYLDNPQVKEDIDCLNIMCVGVSYKELQQIKQDLERLELLEKAIEIIKKPKNLDGLLCAFYDGVGVNEYEEEILTKVIGNLRS